MFSRYIVLILFFFCWSSGSAQLLTDKLFFEHLTTEDGLSHNYVQSIYQDKDVVGVKVIFNNIPFIGFKVSFHGVYLNGDYGGKDKQING